MSCVQVPDAFQALQAARLRFRLSVFNEKTQFRMRFITKKTTENNFISLHRAQYDFP